MSKTVQLGLRIDEELNKEIEFLAESEGVDKMAWIRRALADFVNQERDAMAKEAVRDYINLIYTEKDLKDFVGWNKIPNDIVQARKEMVKNVQRSNE